MYVTGHRGFLTISNPLPFSQHHKPLETRICNRHYSGVFSSLHPVLSPYGDRFVLSRIPRRSKTNYLFWAVAGVYIFINSRRHQFNDILSIQTVAETDFPTSALLCVCPGSYIHPNTRNACALVDFGVLRYPSPEHQQHASQWRME
jgi:hypothetical protein